MDVRTGAIALADGLKVNVALRVLNLEGNDIRGDGVKALAAALRINTTLTGM